jgi:hypothetical protein
MNTNPTLKKVIAQTLLAGGVAVAGSVAATGAAEAAPGPQGPGVKVCQTQTCWCPGRPLPSSHTPIGWDMNVCHDWHYASHDDPAAGDRVVDGPLNCWAIFPKCLY